MLGASWCWGADTDKEAHLTTCCLAMSLSMPTSVSQPCSPKYQKYVACVFVGGSPPVGLVISGTNWCWCADTDKEAHLSFTDGINTWHAQIYCVGLHTSC